jgi:hypothetical protein
MACHRGRWLHFDTGVDAGVFYPFEELAAAVGGITVDRRLVIACDSGSLCGRAGARAVRSAPGSASGTGLIAGQQVGDQALGSLGVPAVARGDPGGGDDLRIGVDRDMPLVAAGPAGGGLETVPGLRVGVEITRSLATLRAIRNTPPVLSSRS